jgi:hypothetical protein
VSKRYVVALVVGSLAVGIAAAAVLGDSLGARLACAALVLFGALGGIAGFLFSRQDRRQRY